MSESAIAFLLGIGIGLVAWRFIVDPDRSPKGGKK